ncbi:MAG: hypothetical protein FJ035_08185 [Chloroflexi bacterium]|nr:hypothetical protein [Chloroflexota bacterium]
MFHLALLPQYLIVGVAIAFGVLLGVRVLDARPPWLGWLFGFSSGLMVGAYIAAMTTGIPLVGSGRSFRTPPRAQQHAPDGGDEPDATHATDWIDELEAELRKR